MGINKSPAGAYIWHAVDQKEEDMAPDAEDELYQSSNNDDNGRYGNA